MERQGVSELHGEHGTFSRILMHYSTATLAGRSVGRSFVARIRSKVDLNLIKTLRCQNHLGFLLPSHMKEPRLEGQVLEGERKKKDREDKRNDERR